SPFAFSENRVTDGVELEGLEYSSQHSLQHSAEQAKRRGDTKLSNELSSQLESDQVFNRIMLKPLGETAGGFVPYVAQIIDGKDTYEAYNGGSFWDKTFATAAWIPGLDAFKSIRKLSKSANAL